MHPTMERRRDSHEQPHGRPPGEWPTVSGPAWQLAGKADVYALHVTAARILWTYAVDERGLSGIEEAGGVER